MENFELKTVNENELSIEQLKIIIEVETERKNLLIKSLNQSIYVYTNDYMAEHNYRNINKAIHNIELKISECYNLFGNLKNSKRIIHQKLINDLDILNKLFNCFCNIERYEYNINMQKRILNIIKYNQHQ